MEHLSSLPLETNVNLLQRQELLRPLCLIMYIWKQVQADVIRRCFKHAGFPNEHLGSGHESTYSITANIALGLDDERERLCVDEYVGRN